MSEGKQLAIRYVDNMLLLEAILEAARSGYLKVQENDNAEDPEGIPSEIAA